MTDRKHSVGIGVEARVDKSVSRAFSQVEQQNRKLGKDAQSLSRDTQKLGRDSTRTGTRVGGLGSSLRKAGAGVKRYTRDIGQAIRKNNLLRKSVDGLGDGLDTVGNQWTALATGAAGAGSAVAVMGLEERYERLGIQAGKSRDQMAQLRKEMFATSQQSDIRVDQGEMLAAVEKIVEKTGDLQFARENMANIGRVMQATGAAGLDVGEMFADMSTKFGLKNSEDVLAAIDTLVVQGKAGAFTLQNLAAEGAAVSAAYAAMGRSGPKAVQEMGAMLQISRMGSGSAAEAASAMESVLADITSNYGDIEALGIEVFDQEALARGEKKFRDLPSIVKEIMEATNSDITEYSQLFGDEAMRFMKVLSTQEGKQAFDSFLAISGDGIAVLQDSTRAAKTANAAMMSLKTAWMGFADEKLTEPIANLADLINSIDPDTLANALTGATAVAGALGAAWVGRKAWNVGKSVAGFFGGGDSDGSGPELPGDSEVSKVYVTNMPDGGFGADGPGRRRRRRGKARPRRMSIGRAVKGTMFNPGVMKSLTGATSVLSKGAGMLGAVGRRIPYMGALMGAMDIGSALMDDSLSKKEKAQEVGGNVGQMGGIAAGAAAGAAIGSVVPVIGTAVGGVIGSVIGGIGMEKVGRWAGGWFADNEKPKVGDSITNHSITTHNTQTDQVSTTVQPVETNVVEITGKDSPAPKAGDTITTNHVKSLESRQLTNNVQQVVNPKVPVPASVQFAPVFHVTGSVDDGQVEKLEKMVMRIAKQLSKLQGGNNNMAFAD